MKKKIGAVEATLPQIEHRFVKAQTSRTETGMCVFYFVKCVALLLESLVASCIRDGKQDDSFSFSNFESTHIFFRGIDRGGEDVIDMTRYGNRSNGNRGDYCVPISVLECGMESYNNLKNITLSAARSKVMEPLHEQRLHIFEIVFRDSSSLSEPPDVCCVVVEFASEMDNFHPCLLSKVDVGLLPTKVVAHDETEMLLASAGLARDREVVGKVSLHNDMLHVNNVGHFQVQLRLQLIAVLVLNSNDEDLVDYIGFILFGRDGQGANEALYSFRFEASIERLLGDTIV